MTQCQGGFAVYDVVIGRQRDARHGDMRVVVDGGFVLVLALAAELHLFDAVEGFGVVIDRRAQVALC